MPQRPHSFIRYCRLAALSSVIASLCDRPGANFRTRLGGAITIRAALVLLALCVLAGPCGAFDGKRALADVHTQCDFGARVPGTTPHVVCRDWIEAEAKAAGRAIWRQPFEARLAIIGNKSAPAWNLWALPAESDRMAVDGPSLIMISAHWDTRPVADNDPPRERGTFLGANDGGSGVAVCLEMARALKGTPAAERVIFAFLDAEDSGSSGNNETWCLGARFAAKNPPAWFKRVKLGINLDMIGGEGMKLARELTSQKAAPEAMHRLWRVGMGVAPDIFEEKTIGPMVDDHVPFIEAGTPYIDLIGLPYPYWHRTGDLPGACSAEVMRQVGETLLNFTRRETAIMDTPPKL